MVLKVLSFLFLWYWKYYPFLYLFLQIFSQSIKPPTTGGASWTYYWCLRPFNHWEMLEATVFMFFIDQLYVNHVSCRSCFVCCFFLFLNKGLSFVSVRDSLIYSFWTKSDFLLSELFLKIVFSSFGKYIFHFLNLKNGEFIMKQKYFL